MKLFAKRAETVSDDILFSVAIQIPLLTMSAMIVHGPFLLLGFAAIAYWLGFTVMFVRRGRALTKADRFLVRWGYLMLAFISLFVTAAVVRMRGY